MRLVTIERAQEGPHREGDEEGQHDIRNQNASEKE